MHIAVYVASMLLTLGVMAHGRDRQPSTRYGEYQGWVYFYQEEMGLEEYKIIFLTRPHPSWCAWVARDAKPAGFIPEAKTLFVGLAAPGPSGCRNFTPKRLALHEMCHVRMMHLWMANFDINSEVAHREVAECMKAYERKEKKR